MKASEALDLDLLSPSSALTTEEKSTFRYWRIRIMYASIIGYAAFYLVRQNFSLAIPGMMDELGYSKVQLGMIATIWSIIYGVGKFVNGYLSDRSDARYFITLGLVGSAATNLVIGWGFGFTSSLVFLGFFWGVNGWFQSMGWPPCARLVTHWFSPRELGTKWSFWASSHQIGAATITALAGFLNDGYGWRSTFYVPAVIAIFLAIFLFNRLRDTPQEVGLPPVEAYKGDASAPDSDERITLRDVISLVFANRLIWYVGIANMCLYIPRMGVFFWAPTFLKEFKGFTLGIAGLQISGFEVAGILGGITAGWLSDRVFEGRRGPVGTIFMLALAPALYLLWTVPAGHQWIDAAILIFAGFLIYGPQVIAGIASADFASKRAVGVATGFTGSFAYIGSAIAGVGIGLIVEQWGWSEAFLMLIFTSLIGAFFFALTWNHRAKALQQD